MADRKRRSGELAILSQQVATTRDGRDITRPFIGELHEPRDPRLWQSVDWGIYDRIRKDDQVRSTMQQRLSAVTSRPWEVKPGGERPIDIECAERLEQNIERLAWDRVTEKMLWATLYGYQVAEFMWGYVDGLYQWTGIKVRHARRFRLDKDDKLRLLTMSNMRGDVLPDRKFWLLTAGATDDDEPYGEGLADALYWPVLFKRNGIKFWNIFLDKFGTPTAKGTYRPGTPQADIEKLLGALQAIATDSGFVIPEGMAVDLLEVARSGTADFAQLCGYMDGAIAKIVLSQVGTTENGKWAGTANTHDSVKLEVIKADADLLSDSFNEGPATWWRDFNYPDAALPQLRRIVDEPIDRKSEAETDRALSGIGWERTEESFRETFGDGYVRKAKPDMAIDPALAGQPGIETPGKSPEGAPTASFALGERRPLYVMRRVLNSGEIISWAKRQGLKLTVAARDLHVTVTFSRRPVDWMEMGTSYSGDGEGNIVVPAGGARLVERMGTDGPVALVFASEDLVWRNRAMRELGASWDYPDYHPHITLADDPGAVDIAAIEPYRGPIRLGPEIFEALDPEQSKTSAFAEADLDDFGSAIDGLLLTDMVDAALRPMLDPVLAALLDSDSFEDAADRLIPLIESMDPAAFIEIGARAGFAVRLAAELGDGEDPGTGTNG